MFVYMVGAEKKKEREEGHVCLFDYSLINICMSLSMLYFVCVNVLVLVCVKVCACDLLCVYLRRRLVEFIFNFQCSLVKG